MKLSVVIPTHNRRDKLLNLLKSLESQTRRDFETIVVDDASEDGTKEALQEYENNTSLNVTHLRQGKKGPAAARNLGIQNSSTDLLLFLNDDVIADGRLIEEHIRFHANNPGTTNLGWIKPSEDTRNGWNFSVGPHFHYHWITHDWDNLPFLYFITANLLVERPAVLDAGLFDDRFTGSYGEDIDLGYRLQKKNIRLVFNRKAIVYHHHPLNVDEFCRQQYMRGFEYARFVRKYPKTKSDITLDVEHTIEIVLKQTADTIRKLYGYEVKPETLRKLAFNRLSILAMRKYVQYHALSRPSTIHHSLGKIIWIYYTSRGYNDSMRKSR